MSLNFWMCKDATAYQVLSCALQCRERPLRALYYWATCLVAWMMLSANY